MVLWYKYVLNIACDILIFQNFLLCIWSSGLTCCLVSYLTILKRRNKGVEVEKGGREGRKKGREAGREGGEKKKSDKPRKFFATASA